MGCNSSIPIDLDPMIMKTDCKHDKFSEEVIVLPNGSKRNMCQWIPSSGTVKAVVLVAHGLHEHTLVCDKVCHAFTAKDIACFGKDSA
jgi:alpha-beta hydrolase superfamily lysophospholipase